MKFSEKLQRRVTELGINKAKAARDAGLPESTISSYLARTDSLPRLDIAAKIATALKVPLSWLADDDAEFPVPEQGELELSRVPDHVLMGEACRRLANGTATVEHTVGRIRQLDRAAVAANMLAVPVDEPLPERFAPVERLMYLLGTAMDELRRYEASRHLKDYVAKPPSHWDAEQDVQELRRDDPYVRAMREYLDLRFAAESLKRHGATSADRDLDGHRAKLLDGVLAARKSVSGPAA